MVGKNPFLSQNDVRCHIACSQGSVAINCRDFAGQDSRCLFCMRKRRGKGVVGRRQRLKIKGLAKRRSPPPRFLGPWASGQRQRARAAGPFFSLQGAKVLVQHNLTVVV